MKKCCRCGLEKPYTQFYQKGTNKSGRTIYRGKCKECYVATAAENFVGPPMPANFDVQDKTCKVCGVTKPSNQFRRNKCKVCDNRYHTERRNRLYKTDPNYRAKYLAHRRKYKKNKRLTDPNFMLACRVRARHQKFRKLKPDHTDAVLGCTWSEFEAYIEGKFQPGMSWDNQHLWHLDHIKPLSWFNLEDPQQYKESAHYTNYQPLWAEDNMKKGNRYAG